MASGNSQGKEMQEILEQLAGGSEEKVTRTVKLFDGHGDLKTTKTESTTLDPDDGRRTHVEEPVGGFLPDGSYLPDLSELEGICVLCREEGEFTPIYGGNGGRCGECGRIVCLESHGSLPDEPSGRYLCEDCRHDEKIKAVRDGIFNALKALFTGGDDE